MTERSHDAVIIPYRIRKEQEDERRLKALEAEVERLGAENIDPENIHFVMSHPEAVARQMTRDTERIKALEAAVERLGARVTEETRLRNHWRGKAEQLTADLAAGESRMPEVVYFVFGAHWDDWHWEHRVYESEEDAERAADIMRGNDDMGYRYSVCEMVVVPARQSRGDEDA